MGLERLNRFLNRTLAALIGVWFGEDQRTNIIKSHMFERNGSTSSNTNNYSTLNIEHNWEGHEKRSKQHPHTLPY